MPDWEQETLRNYIIRVIPDCVEERKHLHSFNKSPGGLIPQHLNLEDPLRVLRVRIMSQLLRTVKAVSASASSLPNRKSNNALIKRFPKVQCACICFATWCQAQYSTGEQS